MWLQDSLIHKIIDQAWNTPVRGSAAFSLPSKLRHTKAALKHWNHAVFGHVGELKRELTRLIDQFQNHDPSSLNYCREEHLQQALDEVLKREELMWRDKARINWLEDGDANTKFFHLSTILNRRYNGIDCLLSSSNSWLSEWGDIGMEFVAFYSSLFSTDSPIFPADLEGLISPSIPDATNAFLTSIPSNDEIPSIVFQMSSHSSPKPNGFPPLFYKFFSPRIAPTVTSAVQAFFHSGHLLKLWNHTFITLIPKTDTATKVEHYRPISLCNVCYKILSKILDNRLKAHLDSLIYPTQSAFVLGRHISDNSIICHEIMHHMTSKKGKLGLMALKIDMAKAYDRVE